MSTFRVKNVHVEVGSGQKKRQNCVHVVIECPHQAIKHKVLNLKDDVTQSFGNKCYKDSWFVVFLLQL